MASRTWYGKKIEAGLTDQVTSLIEKFLRQPITPEATFDFEQELQRLLREVGRELLETTLNAAEPEHAADQPHDVHVEQTGYRRLRDKSPNRDVVTTFGRITLWRRGYRSWCRDDGESLLGWLTEAQASSGRHKPVLAVGRDGVTFHVQGVYEVGSTATVSVYDRQGDRLGTVSRVQPSEAKQTTLSEQLTSLIRRAPLTPG